MIPLKNGQSSKELIIQTLGKEHPLSLKQLFDQVKKAHAKSVTYQAVHKILKQLERQGVIECKLKESTKG